MLSISVVVCPFNSVFKVTPLSAPPFPFASIGAIGSVCCTGDCSGSLSVVVVCSCTVSGCGADCVVSAFSVVLLVAGFSVAVSPDKIEFTRVVNVSISVFSVFANVPSSFFNCSRFLSSSCKIGVTSLNAEVGYFSTSGILSIYFLRVAISSSIFVQHFLGLDKSQILYNL